MGIGEDIFYDAARVAVVPMGFCFPGLNEKGGDLPPRKECSKIWHGQLFKNLPNLKLIVLVGQYAQKWHLGVRAQSSLTGTVSAWRDYLGSGDGPDYFPTPHPSWRNNAWLKKNPWFEEEAVPVLKRRVKSLL